MRTIIFYYPIASLYIVGIQKVPLVAFHVALSSSWSSSGNIAFNRIIQNYGNSWSTITRRFTAPTRGLYYFALTIKSAGTSTTYADIMRGSSILQKAYIFSGKKHTVATAFSVVFLNAGDYVYARRSSGTLYSSSNYHTHFVGFLIQEYRMNMISSGKNNVKQLYLFRLSINSKYFSSVNNTIMQKITIIIAKQQEYNNYSL